MPSSSRLTELCRYHYDPLDRQAACTLALVQPATLQRFYCTSRLTTEIHGAVRTSLFQHDDQLLAQQRHQNDKVDTTLLATDQQRTVLSALDTTRPHPLAYTPYGHRPAENGLLSLLGFNGQRPDPVTGHYHLGNGYRQFNPVLMRFNSPDSWSPFGKGGINAYGYCEGDPANRSDESGHVGNFLLNRPISLPRHRFDPNLNRAKTVQHASNIFQNQSTSKTANVSNTRKNSLDDIDFEMFELPASVEHLSSNTATTHQIKGLSNAKITPKNNAQTQSTTTTEPMQAPTKIETKKPLDTWAIRQLRKLISAEGASRHSHNENMTSHYTNKLIRAGYGDYIK